MSNPKISITGEFASIIKAEKNPWYNYFVSKRSRVIYDYVKRIFPKKLLDRVFNTRIELARTFDEEVENDKYSQIIELGCGFSLRGFINCLNRKEINYIDTDLEEVIVEKKRKLEVLCEREGLIFPPNYHLIPVNLLTEDILMSVSAKLRNRTKDTLVLAEGVMSYFDNEEWEIFLNNIYNFLQDRSQSVFFSHELLNKDKDLKYGILRSLVSVLSFSRSHQRFISSRALKRNLESRGFNVLKLDVEKNQAYYLIRI